MGQNMKSRQYPFSKSNPFEVPNEYKKLQQDEPICPIKTDTGYPALLVTRYKDVKRILSDPRFSLSAAARPEAPNLGQPKQPPGSLLGLDPPEHTRLRQILSSGLQSAHIEALRPRVLRLVEALLEGLSSSSGPVDLYKLYAVPLPMLVICELLGVADADSHRFARWSTAMLSIDRSATGNAANAYRDMAGYFTRLIASKRRDPSDDLFTTLVKAHNAKSLSELEVVMLACTLVIAGGETTTSFLASGILHLLRSPGDLNSIRNSPELLPGCVEELLRLNAHGPALPRVSVEETELSGVRIPTGSILIPAIDAANRDPDEFVNPDRAFIARINNAHLTFGYGPHFCAGAPLARMEMQVAIGTLVQRFPNLRLAVAASELKWRQSLAGGPAELPVYL